VAFNCKFIAITLLLMEGVMLCFSGHSGRHSCWLPDPAGVGSHALPRQKTGRQVWRRGCPVRSKCATAFWLMLQCI